MPDLADGTAPHSGMCFKRPQDAEDRHYWWVISAPELYPDHAIVVVNTTEFDATGDTSLIYNDGSCVIHPGEHDLITKISCICYEGNEDGRLMSYAAFCTRLTTNDFSKRYRVKQPPATGELLDRMRRGAFDNDHILPDAEDTLRAQGLI